MIQGLIKRRIWFAITDKIEEANFVWTQLKNLNYFKRQEKGKELFNKDNHNITNTNNINTNNSNNININTNNTNNTNNKNNTINTNNTNKTP